MQASVNTGGLDALVAGVRQQVEQKWATAGKIVLEAAEFGASTAQSYTRSRPGATTGKAGRVDLGTMAAAIRFKPVASTGKTVSARYGFVGDFEEYFRFQTVTGFRHVRSRDSKFIAPTYALRDSITPVEAFARAQLGSRL
jgi:hypothetical protein